MNRETIERRFAAAMQWAKGVAGRGFQKRVSDLSGVDTSNVSAIIGGKKGGSEEARRAMFRATVEQVPSLPPKGYDDFLSFGQWLLDGNAPEDWKPTAVVFKGRGHLHIKPTVKESLTVEPPTVAPGPGLHLADRHAFTLVPKARARLSAGGGSFVVEDGTSLVYSFRTEWLNRVCSPRDAVLFTCEGESMDPTIRDGETVLIDQGDKEFANDKIFAIGIGETIMVKRLRINLEQRLEVVSDNEDKQRFPTEVVNPADLRILGRVRWHAGEL